MTAILKDEVALGLIKLHFPSLNEEQLDAIRSTEGTLQIVAGPGSGKTLVLVLRSLYMLMIGRAQPKEMVVTTFTEKAAFELRDRIHQNARLLGYNGPLYELKIGTLHSICDEVIRRFIRHTSLKKNYEVLDELTQNLFINDNFGEIISEASKLNGKYLGRWEYKWSAIKGIIPYLNKITEELIDVAGLLASEDSFLAHLGQCYRNYEHFLYSQNRTDFAHQQKILYELLQDDGLRARIKADIKYIMVDEYQDTNYVQEQILLLLASPANNICIVGDEDQSLYRFRGATVRNILEFQSHFETCKNIVLDTNYRSHRSIIDAYNKFMESINWSNAGGNQKFRFDKIIKPDPQSVFPDYPAVFSIWGQSQEDEGERFAQFVKYLKDNGIISDFNQVALLLSSVRLENSGHYISALENHGIPYYAPRARAFFDNEEVHLMFGCYALLFGFHGEAVANLSGLSFEQLLDYANRSIASVGPYTQTNAHLVQYLREQIENIGSLNAGESLDKQVVDYFYELLAFEPFSRFLKNENRARNLATISQLLTTFQNYYGITLVTGKNKEWIPRQLFSSFFKFLLATGIDDYEDPNNPIPPGYVQIMTIHQSKGLEFPVVAVGSLSKKKRTVKQIDRDLAGYYHRTPFEPDSLITSFDAMRQFYVAFSRAEKILVLTTAEDPDEMFSPIWEGLDQWPYVQTRVLETLKFKPKKQFVVKESFSLTSHINVFEVCPRQYQFYQGYQFSPSRSATMTFGTLVHQTIEDIHKHIIEGELAEITNELIRDEWFDTNYQSLIEAGMRPLSQRRREIALDHVLNYFNQNYDNLHRVKETEVDVSVEKPGYILTGKIDLLLGDDGKLEVLDFKTQARPEDTDPLLGRYYKQLCVYAHILIERYGKHPDRIYIYWTSEKDRDKALQEFPVDEKAIKIAGSHFDDIVSLIQGKKFEVNTPPDSNICKECDFRLYCASQGTIKFSFKEVPRKRKTGGKS